MRLKIVALLSVFFLPILFAPAAQAATYKLTIKETYDFGLSMYPNAAESTEADLDSGKIDCGSVLLALALLYNEDSLTPFVYKKKASVKNESGKTIANVQFKPSYKRVGSTECQLSATVSLPRASFYSFYVGGTLFLDSIPFSKVSKGNKTIALSDYTP